MYEVGERTQLGLWVIERLAYAGLWAARAVWHSSGVCGALESDLPVGTPFIRSLDHLVLVLTTGVDRSGSWSVCATNLEMVVVF